MKSRFIFALFLLFTIGLILLSCSDENNPLEPTDNEPTIYGKVLDEQGNPVSGVNVHYVPILIDSTVAKLTLNPLLSIKINFSLPIETSVTLVILKHITRDTLFYLIDNEIFSAGAHSVNFDANSLTNGIYHYVLKYGTTEMDRQFLVWRVPEELTTTNPLTITDSDGNFKLTYKQLGIGEMFPYTSEASPEIMGYKIISDSLQIFLTKQNYNSHIEQIRVDTNFAFRKTFTLTQP